MTTFGYTSGNPNNLTAGASASMADIQGPFVDLRDFLNNGGLDTSNLATAAGIKETQLASGTTGLVKGAFRAYRTAAHALVTNATVVFDTDSGSGWDVSGWFDTSTGIYTPQVPGYYRLSWSIPLAGTITADAFWYATLLKNGVVDTYGALSPQRGTGAPISTGSTQVVANGSTDNFKIRVEHNNGASVGVLTGAAGGAQFTGELIGRL